MTNIGWLHDQFCLCPLNLIPVQSVIGSDPSPALSEPRIFPGGRERDNWYWTVRVWGGDRTPRNSVLWDGEIERGGRGSQTYNLWIPVFLAPLLSSRFGFGRKWAYLLLVSTLNWSLLPRVEVVWWTLKPIRFPLNHPSKMSRMFKMPLTWRRWAMPKH